jgi:hypothetical protein
VSRPSKVPFRDPKGTLNKKYFFEILNFEFLDTKVFAMTILKNIFFAH